MSYIQTLSDVCEFIIDCEHKTAPVVEHGIPSVRTTDLKNGRIILESCNKVSEETYKEWTSRLEPQHGDIILSREAPVGEVGIIPPKTKLCLGQRTVLIRLKKDQIDPHFLLYLFLTDEMRHELISRSEGSVVPHLNMSAIRSFSLPDLPPLPTQHAIAHILGSLDDKIELNRQMNETLEAMARAIFQSWFVDFDPVLAKTEGRQPAGMDAETAALFPSGFEEVDGREVPRGWGVATLGDYIEAVKGLSYKGEGLCDDGIPMHNLNSVLEGGGYKYQGIKFYNGEYQDRHVIKPGDIIVTNTEQGFDFLLIGYPAIVPKFFGEAGIFSHHIFRVRPHPKSPLTNHFIYYLLMTPSVREQVIGCTNGTTVNMMYIDGLITPQYVLPSEKVIQAFEKIVAPIFEILENNEQQSRTLGEIRDALLPKLMSGKLSVNKLS